MQLKDGATLQGGKFRIIRVLGQGGFGITYLAEHTLLQKKVAIKEFFPKQYCDRDSTTSHVTVGTTSNVELISKLKARFIKEARNIARLRHPGIVHIEDVFEENNSAYYVMDYIEGESLQEMVKKGGALSVDQALYYVRQVGNALEYIHSKHMTHFDVKPANIMVRRSDNEPILIDFGLSKQYTDAGDATTTGLTGMSRGYSPIELSNPERLATFSEQSDVYSLAATLDYLLTGTVPPDAADLSSGYSTLEFSPSIPANIADAIRHAMQTNRQLRCPNIRTFLSQLEGSTNTAPTPPTPPPYGAPSSDTEATHLVDDENTRIAGVPSNPIPDTTGGNNGYTGGGSNNGNGGNGNNGKIDIDPVLEPQKSSNGWGKVLIWGFIAVICFIAGSSLSKCNGHSEEVYLLDSDSCVVEEVEDTLVVIPTSPDFAEHVEVEECVVVAADSSATVEVAVDPYSYGY